MVTLYCESAVTNVDVTCNECWYSLSNNGRPVPGMNGEHHERECERRERETTARVLLIAEMIAAVVQVEFGAKLTRK